MQIETKVFGSVEVDETQIIELITPMPGLSDYSRFLVLDPDPSNPLKWFQSVEERDLCFVIADPKYFFPDHSIAPSSSRLSDLKIDEEEDMAVAVVVTLTEDPSKATANLLAPLVFNTKKKLARQVILEGSGYPVRARLFEEEKQVCHGA